MMNPSPGFTLCFLLHGEDVLLIHRRFPPNQGLWNGVGGHIKPGESPRQAVIREVAEETGYQVSNPKFAGMLTWEGFEIPPGCIAIFTAQVPHRNFVCNHEGELAWKAREWACAAPEVVDNIHVFLPGILKDEQPRRYHFTYLNGKRVRDQVFDLPEDFDPDHVYLPDDAVFEEQQGEYLLSMDKERLQLDRIVDFLANQSYWAEGRTKETVERSIQQSVCYGVYKSGVQVAFARLVTDDATFAWLADVFVEETERGKGLGKWLVETTCRYADQHGIKRMVLATRDAQTLYANYGGFEHFEKPEFWMTRVGPGSE